MAVVAPGECAICIADLDDAENVTLCCGHTFHNYCMQKYMSAADVDLASVKCPMCKRTSTDFPDLTDVVAETAVEKSDAQTLTQEIDLDSEATSAETVGLLHPKFDKPTVFCSTCGQQVVATKCRLLSKRSGSWRCDGCNCKVVQLFRGFGTWPSAEFRGLPEADQQAFFKSLGSHSSGSAAVAKAKELLAAHEKHETFYEYGGQFLPLSVWGTKGFDVSLIEAKTLPEDRNNHAVLGPCFRVKIMSGGSRGSEGTTRTSNLGTRRPKVMEMLLNQAPVEVPAPAEVTAPAVQADEVEPASASDDDISSESESSSDSDSSSDSSRKKGHKKSKKSKKHGKKDKKSKKHSKKVKKNTLKKAAAAKAIKAKTEEEKRVEKEAQAAQRASLAKEKATAALAQQIVNKVNGPLTSLTAVMAKPDAQHLPSFVSDSARNHAVNMQNVLRQAQRALADRSSELTVASIKEVAKMISEARKTEVLMNQMLISMGKLI